MSRIGRLPVTIPTGTKVHVGDGKVRVEGPKGKLERVMLPGVVVTVDGAQLVVTRSGDSTPERAQHGLSRKLIANMVEGASKGFSRTLEITGVGYRADLRGSAIFFALGYSHPILFQLPKGVTAKVERQVVITLEAADREQLGEVAAQIRELRPPEPYKGKGIKYAEERIRRKAGKTAAGASR
jgi:large subunit ribosomal protein L6